MDTDAPKTILILMSDTGGGHRTVAEAIREAVQMLYPEQYTVVIEDLFLHSRWPGPRVRGMYLPLITYAPWAWGRSFHWTTGARGRRALGRLFSRLQTTTLKRLYARYRPALVVCVHPMMTTVPCRVLRAAGLVAPFVTVVTDLMDAHPLWFEPRADLTIVPNAETATRARRWGMPPGKVRVAALPIRLDFDREMRSKRESRTTLGLNPDWPVALLVGGGEGMGQLREIATAISTARLPLQLAVIAGRNAALKKKLDETAWDIPVRVEGFVSNMPVWMRAADLIITKAGPSTIMEALASEVPILLSGYLPGQEEGNVRFVADNGVGVLRPTPHAIVEELRAWLAPGDETLEEMGTRARALARPEAALEVAALLVEQIERAGEHTDPMGLRRPVRSETYFVGTIVMDCGSTRSFTSEISTSSWISPAQNVCGLRRVMITSSTIPPVTTARWPGIR